MPGILDAFLQRLQGGGQSPIAQPPIRQTGDAAQTAGFQRAIPRPPVDAGALRNQFVQNQGAQGMAGTPPPIGAAPEEEKKNSILPLLMKLGIPIGAAIAGSVNPNLLPQAAGLSTGFTEELQRQDAAKAKTQEEEGDRDFIIIDPESGEQQSFKVPKKALVQQKRTGGGLFGGGVGITFDENGNPSFNLPEEGKKIGDATKRAKAKTALIDSGRDSSDASIDELIKRNPDL